MIRASDYMNINKQLVQIDEGKGTYRGRFLTPFNRSEPSSSQGEEKVSKLWCARQNSSLIELLVRLTVRLLYDVPLSAKKDDN